MLPVLGPDSPFGPAWAVKACDDTVKSSCTAGSCVAQKTTAACRATDCAAEWAAVQMEWAVWAVGSGSVGAAGGGGGHSRQRLKVLHQSINRSHVRTDEA